jgi:hypothetical protein
MPSMTRSLQVGEFQPLISVSFVVEYFCYQARIISALVVETITADVLANRLENISFGFLF